MSASSRAKKIHNKNYWGRNGALAESIMDNLVNAKPRDWIAAASDFFGAATYAWTEGWRPLALVCAGVARTCAEIGTFRRFQNLPTAQIMVVAPILRGTYGKRRARPLFFQVLTRHEEELEDNREIHGAVGMAAGHLAFMYISWYDSETARKFWKVALKVEPHLASLKPVDRVRIEMMLAELAHELEESRMSSVLEWIRFAQQTARDHDLNDQMVKVVALAERLGVKHHLR